MSRKFLVVVGCLLMLAAGSLTVYGQEDEGQFEETLIRTNATDVVGLGDYVAGEAYAVAAGEDPAEQPMQALILPYAIYPSMGVATIEDFQQPDPAVEGFTFAWSLTAPEGSAAALLQEGTVAIFQADVEGQYDLTLTATDANGNTAEATWTTFATTYVGVGGIAGEAEMGQQCSSCHFEQAEAWMETGHATFFTRAIDGLLETEHYGANCISCHTTGFNNRPEAENGGFDDLAREAGWLFPEVLEPGNWAAMVEEFPEVAELANIQCESCHGPGNLHVNATGAEDHPMIGLGMSYGTCAQCHGEEPYHVIAEQWELSAHADKNAEAFWYPIGEDHLACVRCHSGVGYIDYVSGVEQEELRSDYQVITCAVCHDPHDAENPNQLRVFDEVVLPDGTDVTAAGPAATCMTCHNARTDPVASVEGENFSTPHYSTAAELMNGTGGYTWGETLPTGSHGFVVTDACIGCHMGDTPGVDDVGTPDDTSDDQPLPGHNTAGDHTFSMVSPVDGTENVAVCQDCHGEVESFAFEASDDFDGDGAVETNQDEVAGLLEVVQGALGEQGVEVLESYPYFTLPENPSVDLKGAVYNFKFARDDASAVHNLRYTVALLQLTYEKLAGEPVPGATILPPE